MWQEGKGGLVIVAKDVAEALGYAKGSNPTRLFQTVPEEWKGVKRIHTPGGLQDMLTLTEQGLYFFLGRSDKPAALPFQKWLAGEVLPSIRKTAAIRQRRRRGSPMPQRASFPSSTASGNHPPSYGCMTKRPVHFSIWLK